MTKKEISLLLVIIALLSWNTWTWYHGGNGVPEDGIWISGKLVSKQTKTISCPDGGIQVIDPKDWKIPSSVKPKIKEKIVEKIVEKEVIKEVVKTQYPDWFDPENTALLADTKIPAWKGETYVVSTLNLTTGRGDIKYTHLPRQLFGIENEARIELGYIIIGDDAGKFMISGQYTPFRMGNWYLNGLAQVIGDRFNAGASIEYRW